MPTIVMGSLITLAAVTLGIAGVRWIWSGREATGRRWSVVVVVWALVACGSAAQAAFSGQTASVGNTFQTASAFGCARTRTVISDADSYLDNSNKTTNYGSSVYDWVRAQNEKARAIVHFALPSGGSCTVSAATLTLYAGASHPEVRTLEAYRVAGAWSESTVTWNNQPGTTGSASTTSSGAGWRSWDVTAQVQGMYGGTPGDSSFLIRDATETGGGAIYYQRFDSREGPNKPTLEITFV
jgi:hypothetical protein